MVMGFDDNNTVGLLKSIFQILRACFKTAWSAGLTSEHSYMLMM
jgi:hypothetical protein